MARFSGFETTVARWLDQSPKLKGSVKRLHEVVNYFLAREAGFSYWLHEDWGIAEVRIKEVRSPIVSRAERFFGYYDKCPWNYEDSTLVLHEVRADGASDIILHDQDEGVESAIGTSPAWSKQQGTMAQWAPEVLGNTLVYNDVHNGVLGSRWTQVNDLSGGHSRWIPWPVQSVSPAGDQFASLNYLRLQRLRAEYGYDVEVSNFDRFMSEKDDGLWIVAIESGRVLRHISLARIASIDSSVVATSTHKINHAMYSPSGKRLAFLHRWFDGYVKHSRLMVYEVEDDSFRIIMGPGMVSHMNWLSPDDIVVFGRGPSGEDRYWHINLENESVERFSRDAVDDIGDGHPSKNPNSESIVTDTYADRKRQQSLFIHDVRNDHTRLIGRFALPLRFHGANRIDLHPRWDRSGKRISIDSGHHGHRSTYILHCLAPESI